MRNKQIFALAAALMLSMSGVVFAQELKFDGYLNSGLGIVSNDKDGVNPYWKVFGVDSESNGYRFRLNGSYTNEAKNAGAKFRLQSQRNIANGYFSLPYAYGWLSFLENKITLCGGLVMDSTWETADWWFADDTGEGLGLLIKAEPIKGLLLGAGAWTISQQSGGSNNILNLGGSLPNFGNIKPELKDAKYTFNAAYTMPDTFRLGASFRLKNKAGNGANDASGNYQYNGNEETTRLISEFRFLGLKNWTAVLVGVFDKLDDFSETGNIIISETFGCKLDSLNLGLNAAQFLYNRGSVEMNPGLLFNLWGSYAINNITPRLDLTYFLGGQSKMATSALQWERRGFTPAEAKKAEEKDYSALSIRPSLRINLDNRTHLEIGDMINIDSGNWNGAYADSGSLAKKSLLTNVFYADIKWTF